MKSQNVSFVCLALLLLVLLASCGDSTQETTENPDVGVGQDTEGPDVDSPDTPDATEDPVELEPLLTEAQGNLPSLSALVFDASGIKAHGAVGVRVAGEPDEVTRGDLHHLGSCTKAMTAVLGAKLAEQGLFDWDATVDEVLGEEIDVHDDYKTVTFSELVSHVGGASGNMIEDHPTEWTLMNARNGGDNRATRRRVLEQVLANAAPNPRGEFVYSNMGFIIAGAMLETATDQHWSRLMKDHLFEPLEMSSCGFGPTGEDQPRGHQERGGTHTAVPIDFDNPSSLGPAGTVHCTLPDWAKFARLYLDSDGYLTQESMATLSTLPGGASEGYTHGFLVVQQSWANGPAFTHQGSNTANLASVWVVPGRGLGLLVTTNTAGEQAQATVDDVTGELVLEHFGLEE